MRPSPPGSARTLSAGRPFARLSVGAALVLALVAAEAGAVTAESASGAPGSPVSHTRAAEASQAPATVFQISSFNVLGAGHTKRSKKWANGWKRQGWANQLLQDHGIDVVGFQELQSVQLDRFEQDLGGTFDVFPGDRMSSAAGQNSIAWRTSMWSLVETRTVRVPYFGGNRIAKPYVLLRHRQTGQLAWFYNTHHPADARGEAQRWRDRATAIEIGVFRGLDREFPGIPVFATGDMNDREEVFCPYVRGSDLRAANGGGIRNRACYPPDSMKVDWVFGSSMAKFPAYQALRDVMVQKTTDHPMINATASIPPAWAQSSPVKRVVVVQVDGLRSDVLTQLGAERAPRLTGMMARGASTLNARTSYERTTTLPNVIGIVSGRPVLSADGGHGVMTNDGSAPTVHDVAGRYVSSVFDLVHNNGRSTALYSSDQRLALLDRSWNELTGGADHYGLDNGFDKIDDFVLARTDGALLKQLRRQLASAPRAFTLAHLSDLARTGREHGWMSRAYLEAATRLDTRIGRVLRTVKRSETLRGRTLVVVTGVNGGRGTRQTPRAGLANFRVPLIVQGPGVAAGRDLYDLNPSYADPGTSRPAYSGVQPLRQGAVANLVLAALRLPAIPGSRFDSTQSISPVSP